jgi:ribulose-bisphosphate carboxylase large chain
MALRVCYQFDVPAADLDALVASVLLEQSVEVPHTVALRHPFVRTHLMGTLERIEPDPEGGFRVWLALPTATALADPAQFLNVLFGNVSLHPSIRLLDFDLPPALWTAFPGPRFGLEGLRALTGVPRRALTCAALKPVGLTVDELAGLCRDFAEGGIDLIKDDHYLADHPFAPFEARVRACLDAVSEANARTGRRAVYIPNLSGAPDQVKRQAAFARQFGVRMAMVAPMLVGLPSLYELTHHFDLPVMAHPSFAGTVQLTPPALFGKLFRLFGADAVIFASYGGRFGSTRAESVQVATWLRQTWGPLRPALPVLGGGMQVARVPELVAAFGPDVVLLVGGNLLEAGAALVEHTRAFTEAVATA